jgi:hypothetical protein
MNAPTNAVSTVPAATKPPRIITESTVPVLDTGLFEHMHRIATVMARSNLLPDTLTTTGTKDNKEPLPYETVLANAFLITNQAVRWGLDPFAVVGAASVVHGRLCYEGKLVAAVIEAKAGIRLDHAFVGEGENMRIYLSDVPFTADEIANLRPDVKIIGKRILTGTVAEWKTAGNNSPWSPKAYRRQLIYRGSRDWTRIYEPALLLGVYTQDEMAGMSEATPRVRDQSPALARIAAARASQEVDTSAEITDHVARETAAMDRREAVDDAEFTETTEPAATEHPGDSFEHFGDAAVGGEDGNQADEDNLSPEPIDVDMLERFSAALMRASSAVGLKTYAGDFWTKAGGAPEKGSALHTVAGRIWRQHDARIAGSIDVEGCRAAVDQIIGEVA